MKHEEDRADGEVPAKIIYIVYAYDPMPYETDEYNVCAYTRKEDAENHVAEANRDRNEDEWDYVLDYRELKLIR